MNNLLKPMFVMAGAAFSLSAIAVGSAHAAIEATYFTFTFDNFPDDPAAGFFAIETDSIDPAAPFAAISFEAFSLTLLGATFTEADIDLERSNTGAVYSLGDFLGLGYSVATTPDDYPLSSLALTLDTALGLAEVLQPHEATITFLNEPLIVDRPTVPTTTPEPAIAFAACAAAGLSVQRRQRT